MKKLISNIEEFVKLKSFALIGVSARKKKFGNEIMKQMLKRGFKVYPIHRNAMVIDGERCYPDIDSLPEKPEGIILCIHPAETEKAVKDIAYAGIKYIWMQQGAESKTAIEYCTAHDIKVVSKQCMLMFLNNLGFPHSFHKWIWGLRVH
ncbi:MAG TPA: CoA-binding protein [Ignavibacteria bacterium]|jgi:hypothetical protein